MPSFGTYMDTKQILVKIADTAETAGNTDNYQFE